MRHKPYLEPADIASQTLITYPIERTRLDIFTRFLDPADVEPAQVRTSELTVMMMQLVASGRGVCSVPNWALHEYSTRGYVTAKRLGEKGLFATLYAGIRADMLDSPFMRDFLLTAKRDTKAALRFLRQAIRNNGTPVKINIDKSGANTAAIEATRSAARR